MTSNLIDELGGPVAVSRMCGVRPPSAFAWRARGIPAERCPAIERATKGKFPVERLRGDVHWQRVVDPDWPHPEGRPCLDVAAPASVVAVQLGQAIGGDMQPAVELDGVSHAE